MITGACHYLWRAVDQDGHVLDILRRGRHDKAIATTFCRKCSRVWISSTKSEKFQPFFRKVLINLEIIPYMTDRLTGTCFDRNHHV
jgi:DDE superfamily endonuclease